MKKLLFLVLFLFSFGEAADSLHYHFGLSKAKRDVRVEWVSKFGDGYVKSKLEFPYTENNMDLILGLAYKDVFLNGRTNIQTPVEGQTSYDTDWLNDILYYKSQFQTDIQERYFKIDLGYKQKGIGLFFSYYYRKFRARFFDGKWLIIGGEYLIKPLYHLNSIYEFKLHGPGIGIGYSLDFTSFLDVGFNTTFYPFIKYDAHGHWNLRDLTFKHNADIGMNSVIFRLFLDLQPTSFIYLNGGYYISRTEGAGYTYKWKEQGVSAKNNQLTDMLYEFGRTGFFLTIGLNL